MKYIEDAYTPCPFYHKETYNSIICEGVIENTSSISRFDSDKEWYKKRYCRCFYKSCRLYKALMKKYKNS